MYIYIYVECKSMKTRSRVKHEFHGKFIFINAPPVTNRVIYFSKSQYP